MSIKVKCPGCTKMLTVPDAAKGKAVKCPSCETRVSVPGDDEAATKSSAGKSAKKPKKPAPVDDESGLAELDLRKVADHEANVCPKCGYDLDLAKEDEDDVITECPQCGWDVEEGGLGEKARKRALKGPDPDKFYPGLWKNSWKFVGDNLMLPIRTFLYTALASIIFGISVLGYLYFSMIPPRVLFFAPLSFVAAMVIPGWLWFLDTEVIKLTLERRDKFKRVNFDFFLAGALGVKFVVWNIIFAGPLLAIPAAIAVVLNQYAGVPWWIIPLVMGVSYLPIIGLWPVVLTHMTMPIEAPGWMFWKVIPMAFRCFKPLFWWFMLFCVTMFPIVLIMGVTLIFTGGNIVDYAEIMETNAALNRLQADVDNRGGAKNKPADLVEPKALTELSQLEDFTLTAWHKQKDDEIHLFQPLYDYTDKEGNSKTYYSRVRGKLDQLVVSPNTKVTKNSPVAQISTYQVGLSHFIALAATAFAWVISLVILALTSMFNMRTNGWFSYYFRERLDLQVLIKETKYVARLPRDNEKKIKSTGDTAAEAAVAVVIFMIIGMICGLLYGAMSDYGIVNGLVVGLFYGAGFANMAAGGGLIIAAFGVSPVWGLLVFFSGFMCCIPIIIFMIREWEEAKLFFFQWLFSVLAQTLLHPIMLIMGIGPIGAVLKEWKKEVQQQNQQGPMEPGGGPGAIPGVPAGADPKGAGAGPGAAGNNAIPGVNPPGAAPAGAGGAAPGVPKPGG